MILRKNTALALAALTLTTAFAWSIPVYAAPADGGAAAAAPAKGRGGALASLDAAVTLTDDEKAQVKPILKDEQKQLKEVKNDAALPDRKAKAAKRREITKDAMDKIRALLTPDQQTKFDTWSTEQAARRGKRGKRGANAAPAAPAN